MIGIAALLHKTKDAVKRQEMGKRGRKREDAQNVEFRWLRCI